jgi:hypothetical protein
MGGGQNHGLRVGEGFRAHNGNWYLQNGLRSRDSVGHLNPHRVGPLRCGQLRQRAHGVHFEVIGEGVTQMVKAP